MEATLSLYTCDRDHLHAEVRSGPDLLGSVIVGPADDWPDLKEICRDERGRFAPCGGVAGEGEAGRTGRSRSERQQVRSDRYDKARELVKSMKEGPQPPAPRDVLVLARHLGTLTVAQLHQLRQEHGLKASGKTKHELQAKLASKFAGPWQPRGTGEGRSPRPDAGVPKGTFGKPKDLTWTTPHDQVAQHVKDILGEGATKEDLAACAGAPDGSTMKVASLGGHGGEQSWVVSFTGTTRAKDENTGQETEQRYDGSRMLVKQADGSKYIHNSGFEGKGAGLQMLGRQVENASAHGFDHIDTDAAGHGGGVTGQRNPNSHYNGYYTWPRFGYDGALSPSVQGDLPPALKAQVDAHGGKISGLMATKAGRDWWLGHGDGLQVKFDLKKGSYSQRTLSSYLKERGILR